MSYPPQQPYIPQPPKKMNIFALIGFISSVVFFLLMLCFPYPAPLALILSIVGLVQTSKDSSQSGKGLAIAGVILSSITSVVAFITLVFVAGTLASY